MAPTTKEHRRAARSAKRRVPVRAWAVLSGALAPALIWVLVVPIWGHQLEVPGWSGAERMEITLPMVVLTGLLAGGAGWILLALLERLTGRIRRPAAVWRVIATVVLLVSFGPPLLTAGIDTATRALLVGMHVAVAAVLVPVLPRRR